MTKLFRRIYNYIFRDGIDLAHQHVNVMLLIIVMILTPAIVVTALIGTSPEGTLFNVIVIIFSAAAFVFVNRWPDRQWPIVMFVVIADLIFLPYMYITEGGRNSGMILWFVFGMIMNWFLIRGTACYIIFTINLLELAGLLTLEYYEPWCIKVLPSMESEIIDTCMAIVLSTLSIGLIVRFLTTSYEKKRIEAEEARRVAEEARKAAEEADRAKSIFLARVSHEVRTPINAVLGMNEMILREQLSPTIRKYSSNIDSAGHTMLSLINDILDFSKIESGRLEIIPIDYSTMNLLKDSVSLVAILARNKGLEIKVENDPETPSVLRGDEIRVRQVITNLLTNGIKYTHQGSVTLRLEYINDDEDTILMKITVSDTGIGISDENLDKLFESFQRVDESKNRNIEGTGLGLPISKQLVELMGGTIEVRSEIGKGSTFTVWIPQKAVSTAPMGEFGFDVYAVGSGTEYRAIDYDASYAKVLVVDDMPINLDVIEAMLTSTGCTIVRAGSGPECLEKVNSSKYDIIFLDHMMPEMDGIETLKRFKSDENNPNRSTPVVVLTANAVQGAREMYLEAGFDDYITKPVNSANLIETMAKFVKPADNPLSFLDTSAGIVNCGGTRERYINILKGMVAKNLIDTINECFAKEDWKNYYVYLHGTKSNLRVIGCSGLPDKAYELEKAGRAGDAEYIRNNHEDFMREYSQMMNRIEEALKETGEL